MNIVIIDSATGKEQHIELTEASSTENFQPEFHVENNVVQNSATRASPVGQVAQGRVAKPHACQVCRKEFARIQSLNVHMRVHTGEKPYSCHLCEAAFSGLTALRRHVQRHNGIKAFKCQYCDKSYVLKSQCRDHEKLHTATPEEYKKYKCDVCDCAYRYPFQLKTHYRVHTGERPIECKTCNKCFRSGKVLYEHVRRVHKKYKPYKCSKCEKQFNDFSDIKRHLLTHSGEKPFQCEDCGVSFKRKFALTRHKSTKVCLPDKCTMDKCFRCTVCDRSFALEVSLDMHMEIVHEDSEENENNCNSYMGTSTEDTSENSTENGIESSETFQATEAT